MKLRALRMFSDVHKQVNNSFYQFILKFLSELFARADRITDSRLTLSQSLCHIRAAYAYLLVGDSLSVDVDAF